MKKSLFCIVVALLVSGCATPGAINDLPKISDPAQAATVTVVRISSFFGAANTYTIGMDGKDVFGIDSGQHVTFPVESGEHFLAVKCFGGWTPTWKEDAVRFDAVSGKSFYFKVSPSASCADIVPISETEANALLQKSKAISIK